MTKVAFSYTVVGGLPVVRDAVEAALSTFGGRNGYSAGRFTTTAQNSVETLAMGAKEVYDTFQPVGYQGRRGRKF